MPTGYTDAIADGIGFEQFVMRCARGMGALVMMRDEPMDAPIPERFEPSDYHVRKIQQANAMIEKLRAMTEDEATAAAQEELTAESMSNAIAIERNSELRRKYEEMLAKVRAWVPPTPDHEGLKRFMVEQLTESIRFDCSDAYYREHQPKQKTGEQWRDERIFKALRNIDYHTQEHASEVSRTESRNKWLADLRASISA